MLEKTFSETNIIHISGNQYLVLQALLKAASQDKDRFAITRVFYDRDRDQFVATNGHILRIEKLVWLDGEPPENSFFLSKRDLMLTGSQLVLKYGTVQNTKSLEEILVEIEYGPHEEYPEYPYPNYAAVLPRNNERRPLEWIGLSPATLASLNKTFHTLPRGIRFQFAGELRAISMFDTMASEEDEEEGEPRLLGVVMPIRVMGKTPEPLFELKEIERKTPKGADEQQESEEDPGQEDLVEHAARGPVEG